MAMDEGIPEDIGLRDAKFRELIHPRIAAGQWTSVARLVMDAVRVELVPKGQSLLDWLYARIGSDAIRQLIEQGFAQLNSPCCDSGFEKCDVCGGLGVAGDCGCLPCATLGRVRCPFCNGSSLFSYSELPAVFRQSTMAARVALADGYLQQLLARPLTDASSGSSAIAELRLQVMNCDKLIGVFENALLESHQHCSTEHSGKLRMQLHALGALARERQFTAFERLAESWNLRAAAGDVDVAIAEFRAATLRELCETKSLRSSSYRHPFLFEEDVEEVASCSPPQA